jgi:glycosyltransferase involved in cell wall biosynthesis
MTATVGVNCRVLAKPNRTGVGRYCLNLVEALADRADDDDMTYVLFGIDGLPERLSGRQWVSTAGAPAFAHSGLKAQIWEQLWLPRAIHNHGVDLLHTPAGNAPVLGTVPKVTTLHDLSPVSRPEWFSRGYSALYRVLIPLTIRSSDELITVSEFTAETVRDRYDISDSFVHPIPNGVTEPDEGKRPERFEFPERYFLFVGSLNPRKNLSGLIQAYDEYQSSADSPADLVLAGASNDVFRSVNVRPTAAIHTPGYVSEAELGWLYRNTIAFIFPSLYEGFGLPILEAMSVGTPVITSNRGAMAETAGDAAVLVDPEDTHELADALRRVEADRSLREELSAAGKKQAEGFSWARTAAETVDIYRRLL